MSSTTFLSKEEYHEGDIVLIPNTDVKKKLVKGRWRLVCSITNCKKQVQKKGLCAGHLTRNRLQLNPTKPVVIFNQSLETSIIKENLVTVSNVTNAISRVGNIAEQSALYRHGED